MPTAGEVGQGKRVAVLDLCPKCKASRSQLWAMLGEPDGTDNAVMAQAMMANCRECKEWVVTRAHDRLGEVRDAVNLLGRSGFPLSVVEYLRGARG